MVARVPRQLWRRPSKGRGSIYGGVEREAPQTLNSSLYFGTFLLTLRSVEAALQPWELDSDYTGVGLGKETASFYP